MRMSAPVSPASRSSSAGLPSVITRASGPSSWQILSTSLPVLLVAPEATTSTPMSCKAETTDQLFTPPVYSTALAPRSRSR